MSCSKVIRVTTVSVLTLLSIGLLFTYFVFSIISYGDMKSIDASEREKVGMARMLLLIASFSSIFFAASIAILAVFGFAKWMSKVSNKQELLEVYSEEPSSEVSETY